MIIVLSSSGGKKSKAMILTVDEAEERSTFSSGLTMVISA